MSDEHGTDLQVSVREVKTVDFYGDQITAAQGVDGDIYVPLRPLTRLLGLNYSGQYLRVKRDAVLAKRLRTIELATAGGAQMSSCLPLDLLPGWLFGVTTSRMSVEMAAKLNRYREECFKVLWNAFKADILPYAPNPPQTGMTQAQITLEMITAMQRLAQQQVEIEGRVVDVEGKQQVMAEWLKGYIGRTGERLHNLEEEVKKQVAALNKNDERLTGVELRLDPAAAVTEEQASEIVMAVKNVAFVLAGLGKGTYGSVYSELYRRYRISSYKNLPQAKYQEVLSWLSSWFDELLLGPGQGDTKEGAGE